ncbi:hypothetical protein JCGZ_20412 [Jatropha curcas]|uniref:F-box associated beta-propeller type 3 domain-containing protein n=1 Tax=Jatropha curcas TaxID=180498 RepID=A0A067JMR0_JATCU|nr:F-box protein At1g30790 [Jatropha curcas]KDP25256.1 hypothetical protein JCGZ_20412 [Jatropha curcas]
MELDTKRRRLAPNSESKCASSSSSSKSPIPPEAIFGIFTRLPVKSLVRFRCVDKLCSSIITNPSFVIAHEPYPHPKQGLLIICTTKLQLAQTFFIADQNGGTATCCLTVPPRLSRYTTQSTNGIVCMDFGICATVCNPSTRQAITLPYICSKSSLSASSTYFCVNFMGFDPSNKQYKVLNSWRHYRKPSTEYRVFTLGTKEWRPLQSGPPFYAQRESICIDGVIFFRSWVSLRTDEGVAVLIAFDVQKETFRVIHLPRGAPTDVETSYLIRLAGRLVIVDCLLDDDDYCLWLLEDYQNEIWTKHYIIFPSYLKKTETGQNFIVAGSLDTEEIIMAPQCLSTPFYVYYFDLARSKIRRVKILGLPEYDSFDLSSNLVSITNYVENILPLP